MFYLNYMLVFVVYKVRNPYTQIHTNPVSPTILEHVLEWHSRGR